MCIPLYVNFIWCCGFSEFYAQLEEGVESVCNGYMCILQYEKINWCGGFPEIYARLERRMGSVCHRYMYILQYVKLIQCRCFPEICAQLEEGVGSVCHGYMCILVYVALNWCSSFCRDLSSIGGGGVVSLPWVYVHFSKCETYFFFAFPLIYAGLEERVESVCHVYMCIPQYENLILYGGFPEIYAQLVAKVGGQSAMGISAFFYI